MSLRESSADAVSPAAGTLVSRPVRVPAPATGPETQEQLAGCIRRMAAGEQAALAELYDATVGRVHALALCFVRNEQTAEEVVSDVYFESWHEAGHYDPHRGRVLTWLLVRCRSRALDAIRRRDLALCRADTDEMPAESMGDGLGGVDPVEVTERACAVRRALCAMAPARRQVVALSFYLGLSHSQIAAREHLPLGTVKTHMRMALRQLRQALGELR